jgi:hypothetical protein
VVEREASGDFDYLWDDPADEDGLTSHDLEFEAQAADEPDDPLKGPGDDLWDEPDDSFWDNQPDVDGTGHFDAFNDNTWSFTPAPVPWYRTKQAMTAIVATSAAVAAIVVSGVLLVFRGSDGTVEDNTSSVTPTAPTSAAPVQVASSAAPSPEPPPPPPTETAASPLNPGSGYNPTYEPRPTKPPEIGVTRTPITRLPISVAPQQRGPRNGH